MPWVIVIWSMIASACLTLAAIYGLVWYWNRTDWAHLLFALTAASAAAFTFDELWVMRTETPGELVTAMRWGYVPLFVWLVSITWFVRTYLGAGRRWLAWTVCGLRALFLLLSFMAPSSNFHEVSLGQMQFLGETVTIRQGVPNSLGLMGQASVVLLMVFIADASISVWRRGDRRKALKVGGSIEFFLLFGLAQVALMKWTGIAVPQVLSPLYLGIVVIMGYELSHDVLRASQLVRELQRSEAVLREHQVTLQASNKQISELFGRLIGAQETERRRIARDLHDDVSQRVSGLSIMISGLKRRLAGQPDEADVIATLTTMQQHTTALAEEIRDLSHDLHPGVLQHAGLVTALRASCAQFEKLYSIAVHFSAGDDIGQVEADPALCLYRVTQEALRNVAKHADAHRVNVALTRTGDGLQLSIADDGKGFDLGETRRKGAGLGLVSIEERVRLLRGSVSIETHPEGGTRVEFQIPRPHPMPATHETPLAVTTLANVQH